MTEAADSVPAGGISWEYALSQLENELPIGVRIVLTDATQSSGEIRGGELILHLLPGFAKNAVNVPDVLNKIRQKVSALCGAPMQIRLEELQSDELALAVDLRRDNAAARRSGRINLIFSANSAM